MNPIFSYILMTSYRDKLFLSLSFLILASLFLSYFFGQVNITEQNDSSMIFFSASSKYIIILGFIIFTCLYLRKIIDSHEVNFIISKSISRKFFCFCLLNSVFFLNFLIVNFFLLLALFLNFSSKLNILFFGLSLILESFIVISFSLFISLSISSSLASILISICFYILTKITGSLIYFIESKFFSTNLNHYAEVFIIYLFKLIALLIPRLDLLTNSGWLVYGLDKTQDFWKLLAVNSLFILLFSLLFIENFKKKQL